MLRVVADANVLVSAALNPHGASAAVVAAARQHKIVLLVCDALIDELTEVLNRDRIRRRISEESAQTFVDGIVLLAEWVEERPSDEIPQVCDDPDDNYLVALYQDGDAAILVSGDRAVQRISHPNVYVYPPVKAIEALAYSHQWGQGLLPGDDAGLRRHIAAEGITPLITVWAHFHRQIFLGDPDEHERALAWLVVPEKIHDFLDAQVVRQLLGDHGFASRPTIASPEVVYIKLPPNPGEVVRMTQETELPEGTIFATMQRCVDLTDPPGLEFDHWRVYAVGPNPVPPQQIPPRPG